MRRTTYRFRHGPVCAPARRAALLTKALQSKPGPGMRFFSSALEKNSAFRMAGRRRMPQASRVMGSPVRVCPLFVSMPGAAWTRSPRMALATSLPTSGHPWRARESDDKRHSTPSPRPGGSPPRSLTNVNKLTPCSALSNSPASLAHPARSAKGLPSKRKELHLGKVGRILHQRNSSKTYRLIHKSRAETAEIIDKPARLQHRHQSHTPPFGSCASLRQRQLLRPAATFAGGDPHRTGTP